MLLAIQRVSERLDLLQVWHIGRIGWYLPALARRVKVWSCPLCHQHLTKGVEKIFDFLNNRLNLRLTLFIFLCLI
jgi:hypothetical protein